MKLLSISNEAVIFYGTEIIYRNGTFDKWIKAAENKLKKIKQFYKKKQAAAANR